MQDKKHRGAIPLCGLTVYELDNEIREPTGEENESVGSRRQSSKTSSRNKLNRILLITATGDRIVLEALSGEERSSWVGEIRVAVSSLEISAS